MYEVKTATEGFVSSFFITFSASSLSYIPCFESMSRTLL